MFGGVPNTIVEYVQTEMQGADSAHDFEHVLRVVKNCLHIAKEEGVQSEALVYAALFHDVADPKLCENPEQKIDEVKDFLGQQAIPLAVIEEVILVMKYSSFSKRNSSNISKSEIFKIVQDADKLDALGAIGIARTFAYGGSKGNPFLLGDSNDLNNLKNPDNPSVIAHFYQKLFKLQKLMNTPTAQKMAKEREEFMHMFLKQFGKELLVD